MPQAKIVPHYPFLISKIYIYLFILCSTIDSLPSVHVTKLLRWRTHVYIYVCVSEPTLSSLPLCPISTSMASPLPSRLLPTVGLIIPVAACGHRAVTYRRVRWKEIQGRADGDQALAWARRARSRRSTRRGRNWFRLLRRLVPNGESSELGRLMREAADYVERLQVRVRVLRAMVESLSDSGGRV